MRRRDFIKAAACVPVAWSDAARAQPPQTMRRVAVFLGASSEGDAEAKSRTTALQSGLEKLGWTEGRNIQFDYRYSRGNPASMSAHAAELAGLAPNVIVVQGNRPTALMKQETRTIPIVFVQVGDPVGSGLIDNLARPGGNVTGFTHFETTMGGKWLQSLADVAPSVRRAAIMMHPTTPANIAFLRAAEAAASALGIAITPAGVRDEAEIERALADAAGAGAGLVVMPHDVTVAHRKRIVALATQHRLPAVYPYRYFVTEGGLISYSVESIDHWQRATIYVDRILRGAKPADLPVQAPTKFELVINLKTAKALGLAVPPTLLARADEVIE